jgi:HEAT repeat protein/cyclophilin family peptidyl-prolyl cis-trans isomerase
MSWILRLEDQRVLRDPAPPPVAPPAVPVRGRRAVTAPPPAPPDLVQLLTDPDARVRRRAALAVGRVGLAEGVAPLVPLLRDPEPEVRGMAAFALGLIADASASEPLRAALADSAPLVQGRSAEALGLIGDGAAAPAVAAMVAGHVRAGVLSGIGPDELSYPLSPEAEAVRLGLYALVRLKSFDALYAAGIIDAQHQPVSRWWPVAFACARIGDPRATPALRALVQGHGRYTRAFAARGLGAAKDKAAMDVLLPLVTDVAREPAPAVEAVRALGQLADARAVPALITLLQVPNLDSGIRAEAVRAIGLIGSQATEDVLLDLLSDSVPAVRAQAFRALAALDPERFLEALSGLDPDPHWSVRAAIAEALGTRPAEQAEPLLVPMLEDEDQRVVPAVLGALAAVKSTRAPEILRQRLTTDDPVVRVAAVNALSTLQVADAVKELTAAYEFAQRDATYIVRGAILSALAKQGREVAQPLLTSALGDKDWAVRVKALMLLKELGVPLESGAGRPAPTRFSGETYATPALATPPVSTHIYLETNKGTIQIELAVLDAPLTIHAFLGLARQGFFNGIGFHRVVPNFVVQGGDPRGDGEGGPGFTLRDELSDRPYLRGTVGIALDWRDTGGSQFFITHSPQPHLDARYTVIGRVIGGMDVVDQLVQWDRITRVRVWDGEGKE